MKINKLLILATASLLLMGCSTAKRKGGKGSSSTSSQQQSGDTSQQSGGTSQSEYIDTYTEVSFTEFHAKALTAANNRVNCPWNKVVVQGYAVNEGQRYETNTTLEVKDGEVSVPVGNINDQTMLALSFTYLTADTAGEDNNIHYYLGTKLFKMTSDSSEADGEFIFNEYAWPTRGRALGSGTNAGKEYNFTCEWSYDPNYEPEEVFQEATYDEFSIVASAAINKRSSCPYTTATVVGKNEILGQVENVNATLAVAQGVARDTANPGSLAEQMANYGPEHFRDQEGQRYYFSDTHLRITISTSSLEGEVIFNEYGLPTSYRSEGSGEYAGMLTEYTVEWR